MLARTRATLLAGLIPLLAGGRALSAQPTAVPRPASATWKPTPEERIWGLMQVWSEVKFAFPSFDRRPELDWDAKVQEFLPRVLAATDVDSNLVLGKPEIVARVNRGKAGDAGVTQQAVAGGCGAEETVLRQQSVCGAVNGFLQVCCRSVHN